MKVFNVDEILKIAIKLEEIGEKFYSNVANKATNEEVKRLFTFLAKEEVKHKKFFTDMLKKLDFPETFEAYPGEFLEYLNAYTEKLIFSEDKISKIDINNLLDVVDFAINRELEAILYYQEIKYFVPKSQHKDLDKIISEERRHFTKLHIIKEKLEKN